MINKLQTWEQARVVFSFDRTLNIFLESVKKELRSLTDSDSEIGSRKASQALQRTLPLIQLLSGTKFIQQGQSPQRTCKE